MTIINVFDAISRAHINQTVPIAFASASAKENLEKKHHYMPEPNWLQLFAATELLLYLLPNTEILGVALPALLVVPVFILEIIFSFF